MPKLKNSVLSSDFMSNNNGDRTHLSPRLKETSSIICTAFFCITTYDFQVVQNENCHIWVYTHLYYKYIFCATVEVKILLNKTRA